MSRRLIATPHEVDTFAGGHYTEPYGSYSSGSMRRSRRLPTQRGGACSNTSAAAMHQDTELAEGFEITLTGLKKHVQRARASRIVTTQKVGRVRPCPLGPRRLDDVAQWVATYRRVGAAARSSRSVSRTHEGEVMNPDQGACSESRHHTPSDREIRIERIFNAPHERVWKALTSRSGCAVVGSRQQDCDRAYGDRARRPLALRRARRQGTEGFDGRYREVTPLDRIVQTFEWDGMPGHVVVETMTLDDLGDGRTRMVTSRCSTRTTSAMACSTRGWKVASTRVTRRSIRVLETLA